MAVIGRQLPAVTRILLRRAEEVGAVAVRQGAEFGVLSRKLAVGGQRVDIRGLLGDYDDLFLPLFGAHQAGNLACAIAAVEAFARADATDSELSQNGSLGSQADLAGQARAALALVPWAARSRPPAGLAPKAPAPRAPRPRPPRRSTAWIMTGPSWRPGSCVTWAATTTTSMTWTAARRWGSGTGPTPRARRASPGRWTSPSSARPWRT